MKLIEHRYFLSDIILDHKSFINNHDFQLKIDGFISESSTRFNVDFDCGNNDKGSIIIQLNDIPKSINLNLFNKLKTIVFNEPILIGKE